MDLRVPQDVYSKQDQVVLFNQLAVKVGMDRVSNADYYTWLDRMTAQIGELVPGAAIAEKPNARSAPPLNTAIYYDTADYRILPTGALLRTSCNVITHAFCAFKAVEDSHKVRGDYRYVFEGEEKATIQRAPASAAAVGIVKRLLARRDIVHPGRLLEQQVGIDPTELSPAICLEDYRYTFFAWLDRQDALRCSIDRFQVSDLRIPEAARVKRDVSEVEIAIYPHISPVMAADPRVPKLVHALTDSLCAEFGVSVTKDIKYQRSAKALGLWKHN